MVNAWIVPFIELCVIAFLFLYWGITEKYSGVACYTIVASYTIGVVSFLLAVVGCPFVSDITIDTNVTVGQINDQYIVDDGTRILAQGEFDVKYTGRGGEYQLQKTEGKNILGLTLFTVYTLIDPTPIEQLQN